MFQRVYTARGDAHSLAVPPWTRASHWPPHAVVVTWQSCQTPLKPSCFYTVSEIPVPM